MARPKNTDQRRAQIVQGLMTAMADKGYRAATIHNIAQAAGLSPGLLHYHFKTKGEVLLALIDTLKNRIQQKVDQAPTPEQKLDALVLALVSRRGDPDEAAVRAWTLIAAEATVDPTVRDAFEAAVLDMCKTLDELVEQVLGHKAPRRNVREVSASVLALVHGAFLLSTAAPNSIVPGFAERGVRRLLAASMAELS